MTQYLRSDWHSHVATLLDEPLILEWALDYYSNLPPGSVLREELAAIWFNDIALRRWLDQGGVEAADADAVEACYRLIRCLPASRFINFAATLAKAWSTWPLGSTRPITQLLASLDPDRAAQTFADYLEQPPPLSIERIRAIAENFGPLPEAAARALFPRLIGDSPRFPVFQLP